MIRLASTHTIIVVWNFEYFDITVQLTVLIDGAFIVYKVCSSGQFLDYTASSIIYSLSL